MDNHGLPVPLFSIALHCVAHARYVCTGCDDQHCRMLPLFPEAMTMAAEPMLIDDEFGLG